MRLALVTFAVLATAATRGGCGDEPSPSDPPKEPCTAKPCGAECVGHLACLLSVSPCEPDSYIGQCDAQGSCRPPGTPSECGQMAVCDGRACGDTCDPCAPAACMSPVAYACDPEGRCVPTGPDLCPSPAAGLWYSTCGDPVCRGWTADPSVPLCTTQKAGYPCATLGERCDPKSGCNERLLCATTDPTAQGCPISRARYKTDIRYLDADEIGRVRDELMRIKLATYRYRNADPLAATQLGFVIDDVGVGPSVNPDGETVNLYGYTSMAVAAFQAQERELAALRREIASLRSQVAAQAKGTPKPCR